MKKSYNYLEGDTLCTSVIGRVFIKNKRKYIVINCKCGEIFIRRSDNIPIDGLCRDCSVKKSHKTNIRKHRLYKLHDNIKSRCYNKNCPQFKYYGELNIKMCDEWKNDYVSFYKWAYDNGYDDSLTLDRIDPKGDYTPLNCRWVNNNIQAQNTRRLRTTNTSGYRGVSKSGNKWRSTIWSNNSRHELGVFLSAEEAAIAYDKYVIQEGTEHPLNILSRE